MQIKSYGISDIGLIRQVNEDYFIVNDPHALYIVADGMGGHKAGDIASRMAVGTIEDFVSSVIFSDDITWPYDYDDALSYYSNILKVGAKLANKKILSMIRADSALERMGTTLVSLLIDKQNKTAHIANVGDSRLYLVRQGNISQISEDHSFTNEQVKNGIMNKDEARLSPYKNIITRAIGVYEYIDVDIFENKILLDDMFILTTDGLTNMISDEEILNITRNNYGDLAEISWQLIMQAKKRGGDDNITVVLVHLLAS